MPVVAISCGFKSHLLHFYIEVTEQSKSIFDCFFYCAGNQGVDADLFVLSYGKNDSLVIECF